jgi:hypothetical protein
MRCYSCGEYGHKAYNCWNSRKQSIRNASHNMTTRVNKKIWKIKSQVPNKKDEENIAPEIDEVNNRSLGDKTVGQLRGGGGESVVTVLKQLCFF